MHPRAALALLISLTQRCQPAPPPRASVPVPLRPQRSWPAAQRLGRAELRKRPQGAPRGESGAALGVWSRAVILHREPHTEEG